MENMKLYEAITVILTHRVTDLSQTKWNKLLFFFDGAYTSYKNEVFAPTGLSYVKLPYGPVPDNYRQVIYGIVLNGYVNQTNDPYISDSTLFLSGVNDPGVLDLAIEYMENHNKDVSLILEKIIDIYGKWTAGKLSDFSHELDAWKKSKMYGHIDLSMLRNDSFLRSKYNNPNFGELIISST